MTKHLPSPAAVPPWGLALAAMLSVQLGSALSVPHDRGRGSGRNRLAPAQHGSPDLPGTGPSAAPCESAVLTCRRCSVWA